MKYFHKQGPVSDIKDKYARKELARAHAMVALLSMVSVALLVLVYGSTEMSTSLVASTAVLLILVALFSTCVTIGLVQKPRK